jgi:transcriptional regulator with XRE-family HTH domain
MAGSKLHRNIGNFIRAMRQGKGMSQADLAAAMNISPQNVSSYERGERMPSVEWMIRLADALEIEHDAFFLDMVKSIRKAIKD